MYEANAILLQWLLLRKTPFRQRDIFNETGLSRQLVNYHLQNLVNKGLLSCSESNTYLPIDHDGLVNQLTHTTSNVKTNLLNETALLEKPVVKFLNQITRAIVAARVLDLPESLEMLQHTLAEIDASVAELQKAKKYLAQGTKTPGSAAKSVDPDLLTKMQKGLEYEGHVTVEEYVEAVEALDL